MQVTIRHRQAGPGTFFVDCEVHFSEEETAIIHHRGLGKHTIQVPSGIPYTKEINPDSKLVGFLMYVSVFFFILGGIFLLAGIANSGFLVVSVLFLIIAVWPIVHVRLRNRRAEASLKKQIIPLQQLFANPVFTVAASSVNIANDRAEEVRSTLADMKAFIVRNTELKQVETFEL